MTGARRRTVLYLAAWNVHAVHEGILAYAKQAGWILDNAMCYSGEVPEGARPDGVICREAHRSDVIEFAKSLDVPIVAFEQDDRLEVPRVLYDEEAIGAMAARHLLDRGFRTLCFLHLGFNPQQLPRMTGYRREVEAAGGHFIELAPDASPGSWHPPPGPAWTWLHRQLADMDMPLGIMVTNDQIARPVIDALCDMGYHVPTQIAVVGAENDPMLCETAAVTVSSVDTDTRRLGFEAARALARMMDGESLAEPVLRIPPRHVQTRASSDMLAVENLHVAQALHMLWQHFTEPIRVEDVAAVVPITRRRLQVLFLEHVGRTMHEELARVRAARAMHLLKQTDLKVAAIAKLCGFSSSLHLHRTLQGICDVGPRAFRQDGVVPDLGVLPVSAVDSGALSLKL